MTKARRESAVTRLLRRRLAATCSLAAVAPHSLMAAESGPAEASSGGLQTLDWAIIVLYGVSTIGFGWYYGRRQRTTEEYFVGSGKMNPLLIGVSLFATLLSTISYLSVPGESAGKGPVTLIPYLAMPITFAIVAFWLIPVYMRQRVTSAYELLEGRLGVGVRRLGATMFLVLRLVWMSLLIYLAAKAMKVMLGVSDDAIPYIVFVTGAVSVIYTSLGGLQAVVITDFMQTILLFGGALVVVGTVTVSMGGFGWFPTEWQSNWDTQPIFSTDISTRVTVVGTLLSSILWFVCTAGGDQTSVQRFMATVDARAARRAYATQLIVSCVVGLTLGLVGFALLGYFDANPDRLPAEMNLKTDADDIFPHFIAHELPMGISGLVVAAMFAAAMSSVDSGVNSITAVVLSDFGFLLPGGRDVRNARILAFAIGAAVVFGSLFMGKIPGNITAVTQKTSNLLTTPIFCLFFFALFVPFATPTGVYAGAICGTLVAALIAFSGPLTNAMAELCNRPEWLELTEQLNVETGETEHTKDPISFQWISPVALTVDLLVGTVVSRLTFRQRAA